MLYVGVILKKNKNNRFRNQEHYKKIEIKYE